MFAKLVSAAVICSCLAGGAHAQVQSPDTVDETTMNPWTLVIPLTGGKRAAAAEVEVRDEAACRRAGEEIIEGYEGMTVRNPFCVSYDGDVKFFNNR